jgi:hypothetical protein
MTVSRYSAKKEGVIESISHRDHGAPRIVSTIVVDDRDDKSKTQREVGSPDGDTHPHTIKQFTHSELRKHFDEVNQQLFKTLAQQEVQGLTDRSVTVAIDITNWEYYGDRADAKMVLGTKSGDEHELAYRFATLTVVGENVAFTPAMVPVGQGLTRGEIVHDLVSTAQEYFRIGTVLADSEFFPCWSHSRAGGVGHRVPDQAATQNP